ncbi:MAG: HypC/HybG/HupF family hydrogenase formation chaperone [Bacteroidales bacterium]|nr:HypC/HybG/HupF family hydrogenase formation chaperone [Bacteroidales bacterium]
MCLSVPAKILSIEGEMAQCSVGGAIVEASLQMVTAEGIEPGDYVLLHTGFALQKISEEEAHVSLNLFNEFEDFNIRLDEEEKADRQYFG